MDAGIGFKLYEYDQILPEGVFRQTRGNIVLASHYRAPTPAEIIDFVEAEAKGESRYTLCNEQTPSIADILQTLDSVMVKPALADENVMYKNILRKFIPNQFTDEPETPKEHLLLQYGVIRNGASPATLAEYQCHFIEGWHLALLLNEEGEIPTPHEIKRRRIATPAPRQILKVSDPYMPVGLLDDLFEALYDGNHDSKDIAQLPDSSAEVLYRAAVATLRDSWDTIREARRSEGLATAGTLLDPRAHPTYEA